ncbi:helix-turn-helix domain-containing protein [Wolbachia endosymbiont of Folsomia candida]|uniref:helix-turn-helix domain-containing protein n=1 Tax=Wolbachia endosymbiont of Folsomia candida TaxID=169402 RepID=UPI000AF25099|nr:XRE family transcriptional regulator [Wolbachia endosymbiont of Folsomia candida]APR97837.1 hypothetical protein ASM33_00610 [Wolbachia endosymbiont of Folsomia candida]
MIKVIRTNFKTELFNIIKSVIEENNWTQQEAANVLKLDQPKVSSIVNLKTKGFSVEKIFTLLSRLNCDVEIMVKRRGNLDKGSHY